MFEEKKTENEVKKVIMLYYPEPDGTKAIIRGVCQRKEPRFDYLKYQGMIIGEPKIRYFFKGKVKMIYSEVSNVPNIRVNGTVYFGPVIFLGVDGSGRYCDLSDKQMRAIKCVVVKL